jgi:hypothetical protein
MPSNPPRIAAHFTFKSDGLQRGTELDATEQVARKQERKQSHSGSGASRRQEQTVNIGTNFLSIGAFDH